ncbi:MAG: MurR/RpiR family transcriptional regulator [Ruminococcaceae bacterium]|nr:MurR/RpiR family transcriptional regulator [Oscillospiraceae bacterium]
MTKNVFTQLKASYSYMSRVERRIADFILGQPDRFLTLTMAELSAQEEVSQGSINNFARKFFSCGFSALKLQVAAGLTPSADTPLPAVQPQAVKTCMQSNIDATRSFFETTTQINDETVLARAVQRILRSRRIDIYGVYHSGISARDLCFQLISLGIPANYVEDTFMCAVSASTLDENGLVIAISASGRTSEIIDAVQIAKENHAGVLCLTTNPFSPLAKISDDVLLSAPPDDQSGGVGHTRMAQLFVIDSLITYLQTIMQQEDPANRDRLRKFNISHSIQD